jgi:hypothetical protein
MWSAVGWQPPGVVQRGDCRPFERAVAFDFNREEAIAYIEIGSSLVIAGWVCIGIGVVCVPLGIFMMCGCEDCCEDCCDDCCDDCECSCSCDSCCDRYEEWKLEQRLNTSRKERAKSAAASNSAAANNSADFDAEGNLTHYTCEYGVGEWCGFFCRELAGKKPVPAAPPKPMDIQRMEKGETSTSAKKDDKSLDDVFAPEADVDDGKGPAIELALKAKPAVVEATPPADTKEKESEAKKQPKKTASEADSEEESASASVRSV